jgi:hypothetical protein
LLALAERDRLHEQPDKLLALLEPLGRVLLDLVNAVRSRLSESSTSIEASKTLRFLPR